MLNLKKMWENYPTIKGESAPCKTGSKKNFDDQCAIRLGSCLAACGVDTTKIVSKSRHCWQHDAKLGHILAAEELANGLLKTRINGISPLRKIDPRKFQSELISKTGIIFFKDFWVRTGEDFSQRSGDHIDLWKNNRLTNWKTWFLISSSLGFSGDYAKSKEVWFWEIK